MKQQFALFVVCGLLAACAAGGPVPIAATPPAMTMPPVPAISDKQAFAEARAAVLKSLRDPGSAIFSAEFTRKTVVPAINLRLLLLTSDERTDIVCGTVNSKNGFGGYAGQSVFAYRVARKDIFVDEGGSYRPGERLGSIWCVDSAT